MVAVSRAGVVALCASLVVSCQAGQGQANRDGAEPAGNDAGAKAGSDAALTAASDGGMPSGEGIAASYPGDVGIGSDPRVLFADDFESYTDASQLSQRYDAVYNDVSLATAPADVYAGKQALEFTLPAQNTELSNAVDKVLSPEQDVVFMRYYSKFDTAFDVVGSSHNGGSISAHYFVNGNATPGVPADGTNKFLVNYEDWRGDAGTASPGNLNAYVYWPEQRSMYGDHWFPDGTVLPNSSMPGDFGSTFVPRPNVIPKLGQWYEYEFMVKANTPGQRDGRVTFWLDGKIIADFPNIRFRDVDTLKIDRIELEFHAKSNPVEARKWYDNLVVATTYIGPMVPK